MARALEAQRESGSDGAAHSIIKMHGCCECRQAPGPAVVATLSTSTFKKARSPHQSPIRPPPHRRRDGDGDSLVCAFRSCALTALTAGDSCVCATGRGGDSCGAPAAAVRAALQPAAGGGKTSGWGEMRSTSDDSASSALL